MTSQSEEARPTTPTRSTLALATDTPVDRWDALEAVFSADSYSGDPALLRTAVGSVEQLGPGVYLVPGARRPDVVLTAVHGTNHVRDGRVKWADRGTGSLAILLAEITGCAALITLGAEGDGNYDYRHPAKQALVGLPDARTVIDLHGAAHLSDSPAIAIGTAAGLVPDSVVDFLTWQTRLRVLTDVAHTARDLRRITLLAQAHGLRAIQLEVDAVYRPPAADPRDRHDLLVALNAAIATAACPTAQAPYGTAGPETR